MLISIWNSKGWQSHTLVTCYPNPFHSCFLPKPISSCEGAPFSKFLPRVHFLRTIQASLTAADNIPKEILSVFPRPQQTYFTLRVLCMHTGVGCCLLLLSISVEKGVNWRFPELIIARLPSPIPPPSSSPCCLLLLCGMLREVTRPFYCHNWVTKCGLV